MSARIGLAAALAASSLAAAPVLADERVYSWDDTFSAGYVFFREVNEFPARTETFSTAQFAMLVKNDRHAFRICRLHYSNDGKTPVGICEDVAGVEDLAKGTI